MSSKFIKENKNFWSRYNTKKSDQKILIEEAVFDPITHSTSIFTIILNQAKGLSPVWLDLQDKYKELVQSYFPSAEIKKSLELSKWVRLKI